MLHFTPTPNPSPMKRQGLKCNAPKVIMLLGSITQHGLSSIALKNSPSLILGEGAGGWGL